MANRLRVPAYRLIRVVKFTEAAIMGMGIGKKERVKAIRCVKRSHRYDYERDSRQSSTSLASLKKGNNEQYLNLADAFTCAFASSKSCKYYEILEVQYFRHLTSSSLARQAVSQSSRAPTRFLFLFRLAPRNLIHARYLRHWSTYVRMYVLHV